MATIIKQKETFRLSLKITDAKSNGILDLEGCTARCQMRKEPGGELIGTAQCTVNDPKGTIEVFFSSSQTENFPLGTAGFDVWLITENDKRAIYTESVQIIQGYTDNIGD